MNQQPLFARTPASRSTDPKTSHLAEDEINTSGARATQQRQVLAYVQRWPGLTSRELAAKANTDRYILARRLPELEPIHVRKGDARRCGITQRQAVTWYPAIARDGTG